ncbi:MAG TPA: agmatine deiminase family protein [Actinomycetota bacterium]
MDRTLSRRRFIGGLAMAAVGSTLAACTRGRTQAGEANGSRIMPPSRRWPGEWETHSATLMAAPYQERIYGSRLGQVQREWVGLVQTIRRYEPVIAVVPPTGEPTQLDLGSVDTVPLAYDDMWIRDNGPIVILDGDDRVGLDWRFDGWGGAFDRFGQTWHDDDRLPRAVLERLHLSRESVDMVLEGGAILSGGDGTILGTRENLFEARRNPTLSEDAIETELLTRLGGSSLIALPFGLIGDLTAGHVDGVAAYLGPRRVLAQTDPAGGEEGERLAENVAVLRASTDASGRSFDVIEFPVLPRGSFGNTPPGTFTYINLVFAEGAVIVPTTGDEHLDRHALGLLGDILPDRDVVGVPAPTMNWAGGGPHCVTQPLPAAP